MCNNCREASIIEFLKNYWESDLEVNAKEYKQFLNTLVEIQDYISKSNIKFPKWKLDLDTLITKSVLHCHSLVTIIEGIKLDLKHYDKEEKKIIDIPSSYVLLRAQLDNFLMIDFIYFQPKKEDESEFRHLCWNYTSSLSISKYKSEKGESRLIKVISENEKELKKTWEEIEKSKYLMKLTVKQQRKLHRNGDSRLSNNWNDLMNLSKINPLMFNNLYSILSKHVHSEAIGVFELKNSHLGYHKNHRKANNILLISKLLLCLLIKKLCGYIKAAEIKLNSYNSKLISDIDFYSMLINREEFKKEVLNKIY